MPDAVIAWVNGDDPSHKEKRTFFLEQEKTDNLRRGATEHTRFADNNEIWFCIHFIRKNAPWIHRIFLVTDNQVPVWLSDELKKSLNVIMIDHRVIFSGFEDCLPTFNANTIETMLFRIPGLSDNFLYFNDDVFLIRPTREQDYFAGNKLRVRGKWRWTNRYIRSAYKMFDWSKRLNGYVGHRGNARYFSSCNRLFHLAHAPYPVNKHILEQVFPSSKELRSQIKHRFRNRKQFQTNGLATNIAFKKHLAKKGPDDWGYICSNYYEDGTLNRHLDFYRANRKVKSLCIQSMDQASSSQEASMKRLLLDFLE